MKISLTCPVCFNILVEAGGASNWGPQFDVALGDTPIYEGTCPNGHAVRQIIANPKFELLFESGVRALQDGYFREAVSSFASALERFYEFLMQSHFVDENSHKLPETFSATWKTLSKQSERQIGAFSMLYLLEFGTPAPLIDVKFVRSLKVDLGVDGNDPVNFRNIVVHQGYVPKREQAIAYGEIVNRYVHDMLVKYCLQGRGHKLNSAQLSGYIHLHDETFYYNPARKRSILNLMHYTWNAELDPEEYKYFPLELYMSLQSYQIQQYRVAQL